MQLKNYNIYFFFIVLIGVTILAYFVIKPFLIPFLLAAILAHLFGFMYRNFLKLTQNKKRLSSLLTCLVIALIILIPILIISYLVINEVQNILTNFLQDTDLSRAFFENIAKNLSSLPVIKYANLGRFINQDAIMGALGSFSQNTLNILESTYNGVAHFVFVTFIMFFSLYYLFIEGEKLIKKIMYLSPIKDSYEDILISKFNSISRATVKGTSLVAIMQGVIGSILFLATGVASPILLGILMMIASVIPVFGSGLIWLPVGIIMIVLGHFTKGIIILLVGFLIISMMDNFIRPKLVGRDTELHPLLILFSTLGGIALFGISGFIVGPIIMALFVAMWEIYSLEFKTQLKEFSQ